MKNPENGKKMTKKDKKNGGKTAKAAKNDKKGQETVKSGESYTVAFISQGCEM